MEPANGRDCPCDDSLHVAAVPDPAALATATTVNAMSAVNILTLVRGYIHMGHTSAARPPRPPPRPRLILSREITFWASNIKRGGGHGGLKTIHALGLMGAAFTPKRLDACLCLAERFRTHAASSDCEQAAMHRLALTARLRRPEV